MSETTNKPQEIRPFRCELCNITCNTEDLLQKHKQGKKHLNCLQKPPVILQNGAPKPEFIRCDLCNVVCNNQEIYQKHVVGKKHSAKALIQLASTNGLFAATSNSSGASQKKPNTFQCGLCKITCTSNELLSMHIAGKKHLNKLRESGLIPNLPFTPMVNSESNEGKTVNSDGCNMNGKRAGSYMDVESKKQKILQGGAPLNAIRTCTLCNVVCNSPTVFAAHLAGQKHAAMVVQQAENLTTGQES
ncbi:putative transcription factor C2H2 family [Helianthus annuus]|uniref:Putative zinc finger, U1-type, Zinc finger, C2H2-like protein n=1 Tax=Helianthus annuus TaxID=4232 RepID=A0A251SDX8_HELAN|nr:zinc finger protein 346 isoform X1 [Helianthus annuus]KAF5796882.1 putative transcription factor C2H2 family [Helianthus annuus]KAJ0540139.1 putative transcription factor C2H2 family [Helianthus annuus]KAJ0548564.1 putative transcription factor C2H2 family [Helianthus annuus]KAJ0554883.1 putative transcription factor C2H2 family [Helianthus annuus]KAJ0720446.1 putative transcription factor C2H2 family [Helianthus annuus]